MKRMARIFTDYLKRTHLSLSISLIRRQILAKKNPAFNKKWYYMTEEDGFSIWFENEGEFSNGTYLGKVPRVDIAKHIVDIQNSFWLAYIHILE